MANTCDICPEPATAQKRGHDGHVYRACPEHAKFLAGWVRDAYQEAECDAIASRRFEDAAYGYDD